MLIKVRKKDVNLTGHWNRTGEKLNILAEFWCEIMLRRKLEKDQKESEGSVGEAVYENFTD